MNTAQMLETIHRLTHRHWMKNTSALGLSYSEFEYLSAVHEQSVLSEIDEHHGQHLHDLVTAMGVNKASASAMMDKLEKRKLVRVKPCKRDARAKHFLLSKKGEELRVQGKTAYDHMVATLDGELKNMLTPAAVETKGAHAENAQTSIEIPNLKKKSQSHAKKKAPTEQADALPQLNLFG